MGIIIGPNSSLEEKQASEKAQIQMFISGAVGGLSAQAEMIFNKVWNNDGGLSAQQIFDAFGADGAILHGMLAQVLGLINAIAPGSLSLVEPKIVTVNQDGTVTVSA